jgi:hypothetical protein
MMVVDRVFILILQRAVILVYLRMLKRNSKTSRN